MLGSVEKEPRHEQFGYNDRPEDVELVERIDRLVNREGYTLKGAKAALKGVPDQQAAAQEVVPVVDRGATEIVPRLKAIRDELRRALAA